MGMLTSAEWLNKLELNHGERTKTTKVVLSFKTTGVPRTKKAMAKECDINTIMAKYRSTGILPVQMGKSARFGDFSDVTDYQTSLNKVMEAQDSFAKLPAHIRAKFLNDPANLIGYMQDPKNEDEARKLGLLPRKASGGTEERSEALTHASASKTSKNATKVAKNAIKQDSEDGTSS